LVPSLRKGLTTVGLECGMHCTGKKRHSPAPKQNLVVRIMRMSTRRAANPTDHLVGHLPTLDVPIDESDACASYPMDVVPATKTRVQITG
jgi:hypothetical protein